MMRTKPTDVPKVESKWISQQSEIEVLKCIKNLESQPNKL